MFPSQISNDNSLSVRILHCAPPPRLQVDQHFLTQKIVADPKMRCHQNSFGIWRVTEAILGKKRVFQKTYFEKKNKSHYFFHFLDIHFVDTNIVILKKKSTEMCLYVPEKHPNSEFLSHFLQVSNFVLP